MFSLNPIAFLIGACGLFLPSVVADKCASGTYPPDSSNIPPVRWFDVDLDVPPEKRWGHVIEQFIEPLKGLDAQMDILLTTQIRSFLGSFDPTKIFFHSHLFFFFFWRLGTALPKPVFAELDGMATVAAPEGLNLYAIIKLNLFYEMTTGCTSIVARKPENNRLIHARNLDFGAGLGTWNRTTEQWPFSESLRRLTINARFRRNGKTLYSATTYAGYVAILNGVKKDKFSMSLNQRYTLPNNFGPLLSWMLGLKAGSPLTTVTRRLFEEADTYAQAKRYLESVPLVSPVYFILGGASGDDAAVITRGRDESIRPFTLASANQSWILETNFDHWTQPPAYDDRRAPANQCMRRAINSTSWATLFDVLSTRPILNKGTTYTSLMDVNEGKIETFVRTI